MAKTLTPSAYRASLRAAVARRDPRALARAARGGGPAALVSEWSRLRPLERVAAFRSLGRREAAAAFAALPAAGRWLAYLGARSEGAAPLLEGAPPAARALLRRPGAAELAAMRKVLAR